MEGIILKDKKPEKKPSKLKGLISLKCEIEDFVLNALEIPEPKEKKIVRPKIIRNTKGIF